MSTKHKNMNASINPAPPECDSSEPALVINELQMRLDDRERQLQDALARLDDAIKSGNAQFDSIDDDPLTHQDDPFMNPAEVGRQIGKSPQTVGRWIVEGLITATFFPHDKWMVRKSEVNRLLRGSALNKQVV